MLQLTLLLDTDITPHLLTTITQEVPLWPILARYMTILSWPATDFETLLTISAVHRHSAEHVF